MSLPATAAEALRRHRAAEGSEGLRVGRAWENNDLVFANHVGRPIWAVVPPAGFEPATIGLEVRCSIH